VGVALLFENLRIVDSRAPLADLDISPALQRREQHERVGRAVTLVFVVIARRLPRPSGAMVYGSRRPAVLMSRRGTQVAGPDRGDGYRPRKRVSTLAEVQYSEVLA